MCMSVAPQNRTKTDWDIALVWTTGLTKQLAWCLPLGYALYMDNHCCFSESLISEIHISRDSVKLMDLYSTFLSTIYFPLVDFMGIHSK